MTIGSSNRTQIRRVQETTLGVVPTNPTLLDFRTTGEGINFAPNNATSNEIRSDRQTADLVQVGSDTTGNLDFEFSHAAYDIELEAVLFADSIVVVNMDDVITIAVNSTTDQFTDSANGFITAGIVVGQWIRTSGFANAGNNGYFRVNTVTAGAITVDDPGTVLVTETAGATVDIVGNMIRNGVTRRSFVVQKHIQDIAVPTFINYIGCVVNQMTFDVSAASIITGSFDYQGLGVSSDSPSDSQISGATITPAPTNTPMNSANNILNIQENNAITTNRFSTLSLTVNNNARVSDAVGNLLHIDVSGSRLDITGSLNIYYQNKTAYERFLQGQFFSLSFRAQDAAGNANIFTLPRVKHSTGSLNASGLDSDMIFETEITAIVDPATNSMIQIDRFTA